jgi:hypothetical protein
MTRFSSGILWTFLLALSAPVPAHSQGWAPPGDDRQIDPCGLPDTSASGYRIASLTNWGYGYDSLRADLVRWSASPFVHIDSVGASVQNRALYLLTIEDTSAVSPARKRIWIHARTHPNEVQGTWVTNQIIALLLGDSPLAHRLRDSCVFNIMPMYNPDGVELRYPRENAHNIDIESNWSAVPGEPEVQVLRAQFTRLMTQPNPILVALNMHSSVSCTRYFVYHAAGGTSGLYATLEEDLIGRIRRNFPGGIEPYTYFVSWTTSAPTYYPESWFWYNYREGVLALTYEDRNCTAAGAFDSTARAILQGVGEFLGVISPTGVVASGPEPTGAYSLAQNYPNPFNPMTTIRYTVRGTGEQGLGVSDVRLVVYDLLGREVAELVNGRREAGSYEVRFSAKGGSAPRGDASALATGIYVYRLTAGPYVESRKMVLIR